METLFYLLTYSPFCSPQSTHKILFKTFEQAEEYSRKHNEGLSSHCGHVIEQVRTWDGLMPIPFAKLYPNDSRVIKEQEK
jgi:hypothetical protein